MRVLITAQQLHRRVPGGIGTYVRGLFTGLPRDRVQPVAWMAGRPSDPSVAGDRTERHSAPVPGPVLTHAWDLGLAAGRRHGHVDRVHATSLSVPGHRRSGPPVSCFVHDVAWRRFPDAYPPRGRRWHDGALVRAIDRCDLLMAPSRQTADDLVAAGAPARLVHVVAEGCDHLPLVDRGADGGAYLLSVSTLEPRKNLRRLVEAYRLARPRMEHPWPLRIVGPAGWGDPHDELAHVDGVELLGRVDDAQLAHLLAGARALAYLPLYEGFGLPAMEAMRAGVPVAASDTVPALADGTAITADPHDVEDMARALITALEDGPARAALVQRGAAHAAAHTWARCAVQHAELWEAHA